MNRPPHTRTRTGFTLVEVLIATAVFSLFLGGLFSLYRMGSKMFQAGSWKLQKQKEAERFLASLKERLEQASHAAIVDPTGDPQLTVADSQLGYVGGSIYRSSIAANTRRLMLFAVCKPSISGTPGLLLYHGLRAKPTPGQKGLFDLEMISTTNPNHTFFAGTSFNFFPAGAPDLTKFNKAGSPNPGTFRLGGNPNIVDLTEVASMTILQTDVASESLISIALEFRHPNPRLDQTRVTQRIVSRIAVPAASYTLGGI
ncbi:prepilin-type N-terminal cleavage/methylation domain-containing protein [Candidatus Ozemobacteraceae bacterium]|nr:prepilin-type N-terminal cleavage/methylation domain-containing protein [Candidatus Ozemobacteraceae bacterium]